MRGLLVSPMFLLALFVASLPLTAGAAGAPKIEISPAQVDTGYVDELIVTGTGVDLSKVKPSDIAISPDEDVGEFTIRKADPSHLTLSFEFFNSAEPGTRTFKINAGGVGLETPITVTQGPAVRISRVGRKTNNSWVTGTVDVTSLGGLDLSHVDNIDVQVYPADDVTVMEVTNQSATSFTVGLLYYPTANRTVTRSMNIGADVVKWAEFSLSEPGAPMVCTKRQHCCETDASGACTLCLPRDQLCK